MVVVECLHFAVYIAITLKSTHKVQDLLSFFIFNLTAFLPSCWLNNDCYCIFFNIIMLVLCLLKKTVYSLIAGGMIIITHSVLTTGYHCNILNTAILVSLFLLASIIIVLSNVATSLKIRLVILLFIWISWDMRMFYSEKIDMSHVC